MFYDDDDDMGYPRGDIVWGLKGQRSRLGLELGLGLRLRLGFYHTNSRNITRKRMIPKCSNLI